MVSRAAFQHLVKTMSGAVRGQYTDYAVRKRKVASGINQKPQAEC
jgi:hypothetical protein